MARWRSRRCDKIRTDIGRASAEKKAFDASPQTCLISRTPKGESLRPATEMESRADTGIRIRREDLDDSAVDSCSDAADGTIDTDLQARLHAQIAKSLGLDTQEASQKNPERQLSRPLAQSRSRQTTGQDDHYDDPGEFDFRLFSSTAATKVTLEDESATPKQGALAQPRPPSFYVVRSIPASLKSEYRFAAVSGEDVLLRSRRPLWGMAYPWKVTNITAFARRATKGEVCTPVEGERRRKRPGKKRRIADRQRVKAEREREETEKKRAVDKEEHLKEKKKRLNRLKKLRKRAKNTEMKTGGKGDDGDGDGDGAGGGRSGDE